MFRLVSLALVALAAFSVVNATAIPPREAPPKNPKATCRPRIKTPAPEPTPTIQPTPALEPTPTPGPEPTPTPEPTSIYEATPPAVPSPVDTNPSPAPAENHPSEYHTGGDITYYYQDGRAGACGEFHTDGDFIAAIPFSLYGNTGAKSPYCGKSIRVSLNGKYVDVTIQDACEACGPDSVDLSKAAFDVLAPGDGRRSGITWEMK